MNQGYITIHRKIWDSWVWKKKPFSIGQAWIDLILLANHKENEILFSGKVENVPRGSFITSQEKLKKRWGWKRKAFEKFILNLLETKKISIENKAYQGTSITIINYDTYQNHGQAKVQARYKRGTSGGAINNNDNNEKNNTLFTFFDFWNTYSKKVGRAKTEQKYAKISEQDRAIIKAKLPEYVKSTPDVKFRKNPETWLNGRHWEDEIIKQRTWDDF